MPARQVTRGRVPCVWKAPPRVEPRWHWAETFRDTITLTSDSAAMDTR